MVQSPATRVTLLERRAEQLVLTLHVGPSTDDASLLCARCIAMSGEIVAMVILNPDDLLQHITEAIGAELGGQAFHLVLPCGRLLTDKDDGAHSLSNLLQHMS